jgi:hypothetical protein
MEQWKDIKGYEGLYQVSNLGRVKSLPKISGCCFQSEMLIKPHKDHKGYLYVGLCKNAKYKYFKVHRLVADAFILNPDHKPFINHINYDKANNNVSNLEWVTAKENSQWSLENNRKGQLKKNKPISGHHYIQKRGKNSYRFQFNKDNKCIVRKAFKKLEDAIQYRNRWLELNQPQIKLI